MAERLFRIEMRLRAALRSLTRSDDSTVGPGENTEEGEDYRATMTV